MFGSAVEYSLPQLLILHPRADLSDSLFPLLGTAAAGVVYEGGKAVAREEASGRSAKARTERRRARVVSSEVSPCSRGGRAGRSSQTRTAWGMGLGCGKRSGRR